MGYTEHKGMPAVKVGFDFFLTDLSALLGMSVSSVAGDDDDDETGEERLPSCFDYVMHFLTVFWKVLFACVPPTEYCNGWACFVVSILIIGMLTAIIGDLASHFGCTIGLKDSVTAVVFVAFGTSVPGEHEKGLQKGFCLVSVTSLPCLPHQLRSALMESLGVLLPFDACLHSNWTNSRSNDSWCFLSTSNAAGATCAKHPGSVHQNSSKQGSYCSP